MHKNNIWRRDFLVGIAGLTTTIATARMRAAQSDRAAPAAPPTFMYVGSFTGKERGRGEGLSVYHRKTEAEPWALVQLVKELADPSFLAIDRPGRFLYSSHGDGTQATAFQIDRVSGQLKVLNRQPTRGENGAHLALDPTNRFVAVTNYASGTLAVLPINPDGSLAAVSDLITLSGTPGPHRTQQESSHPHHCPFDRTGRFIVVPDKGFDKIFVFRLDTARGKLIPGDPPSVDARTGAAPRHVDFHPSQPYAYVINELDSTITTCHFDAEKGALKPLEIVTTLPSSYTGNNTGAEIAVAPSGRFLYASNRGHDSIVIFAIDRTTGGLKPIGWEATQGKTPRFFTLDPAGTHLYAANQNSDNVVIFHIDQATGKLTSTGQSFKVGSPTTIVFR